MTRKNTVMKKLICRSYKDEFDWSFLFYNRMNWPLSLASTLLRRIAGKVYSMTRNLEHNWLTSYASRRRAFAQRSIFHSTSKVVNESIPFAQALRVWDLNG